MAWYKRYSVPFQSRELKQYVVYVYEQTSGALVTLRGGESPFVTQEDDNDDIFTPIRKQTGYLRVIDETGDLLETLIPENNVQKLVRLYLGHYSSGAFVEDNLMWQGFLCAEAYTQPWDNQVKMIEFPVKSLLAAMDDIFLPESYLGDEISIAKVFVDAYNTLQETPNSVYCINNLNNAETDFLKVRVEVATFFSEETVTNEGQSSIEYIAKSFYDAISDIAKLYGLMVREYNGNLYIAMFDNGDGKIGNLQIPQWSSFVSIANGNTYGGSMIGVPETSLLDYVDFAGLDNTAGFVLGGKRAIVSVNLGGLTFNISLPQTEETADAPIEFQLQTGKLFVQPHAPRVNDFEDCTFYEYRVENGASQQVGGSDYATTLQKTVINGYVPNPYNSADSHLYTGAFPIRWYNQTEDTEQVVLRNGLYFNTQYKTAATSPSGIEYNALYSISSKFKLKAAEGWIRIDFKWHNIIWAQIHSSGTNYYFDDAAQELGLAVKAQVIIALRVGDMWWNGSAWVEYERLSDAIDNHAYFTIFITNNTIDTNKTADMNIVENDGYFVPIVDPMDAEVTLHILNFVPVTTSDSVYRFCYSHILTNLELSHVRPISIVASERGTNTYIKEILAKGFSEDKETSMSVGTMNNNVPSPCFIKRSLTEYIELLTYYADGGTTYTERPELNLLNRIVAQFSRLRRTFTAMMKNPFSAIQTYDFFQIRFTYLSKKFFGVVSNNDWREDTQKVKFIEVS